MNVLMVIHVKKVTVLILLVALYVTTNVTTQKNARLVMSVIWLMETQVVPIKMNVQHQAHVKLVIVEILRVATFVMSTVLTLIAILVTDVMMIKLQNVSI